MKAVFFLQKGAKFVLPVCFFLVQEPLCPVRLPVNVCAINKNKELAAGNLLKAGILPQISTLLSSVKTTNEAARPWPLKQLWALGETFWKMTLMDIIWHISGTLQLQRRVNVKGFLFKGRSNQSDTKCLSAISGGERLKWICLHSWSRSRKRFRFEEIN